MDRLVALLEPHEAPDALGAPVRTWTILASVWAEVIPLGGKERLAAPQVIAERTARFRIRYRAGMTEQLRLQWDGRVWEISGLAEIGRREGWEITASALEAQA